MVLIPIPYAMSYTATMTGRTPKGVECEKCGFKYVYLLEETVESTATSVLFLNNEGARTQASTGAAAQLESALRHKVGVVPCPACGHVQEHMIPTARRQYHFWAAIVGFVAFGAGIVAEVFAVIYALLDANSRHIDTMTYVMGSVGVVLLIIGITLVLGRFIKASSHNPNDAPAYDRIQRGRELAVSLEEFLKIHGTSPRPAQSREAETQVQRLPRNN